MNDIYTITVGGRATKDVELKTTQSGKEVCSFSVATDVGYGDNKHTKYTNLVIWGGLANVVSKYVKKGTEVIAIGDLSMRSYEHNGETKVAEEVNVKNIKWYSREKAESSNPMSIAVDDNPMVASDEELPF